MLQGVVSHLQQKICSINAKVFVLTYFHGVLNNFLKMRLVFLVFFAGRSLAFIYSEAYKKR